MGVIPDLLNRGRNDGGGVFRMAKLEVHSAADKLELQHGASPGRARDGNLDWVRAEFRMAGEKGLAASQ
jgi:hypothetical protein